VFKAFAKAVGRRQKVDQLRDLTTMQMATRGGKKDVSKFVDLLQKDQ
jgi:hypothetical protein